MTSARLSMLLGLGSVVGSLLGGTLSVHAGGVAHHPYPPLDPAQVECTAFRPANDHLCYQTANDLHQLFELVVEQIEQDEVATAIQETVPVTPLVFPNGTVVYGFAGFASIVARWADAQVLTFGPVAYTFRYRPLNRTTVVAYGRIQFTIEDHDHQTTRVIDSVQTELFRRNPRMPRGWEQIYAQLAYTQPLLGDLTAP